jgi:putative zinc finger/helix-turn-helix YgiT family protein
MTVTRENHRDRENDLDQVTLVGLEVRRCRTCGNEELVYHRLGPLHRSMALAFARKPGPLVGSEIGFLRAWLGWSGKDMAAYLGVSAPTVSRWENGRLAIGAAADRLLRLIVVREADERDYSLEPWKQLGRERRTLSLRVDTRTLEATWQTGHPRAGTRTRTG